MATADAGFVISGAIEYEFEDGGTPLTVGEGDAFALSTGRAHRGTNRSEEATRLVSSSTTRRIRLDELGYGQ